MKIFSISLQNFTSYRDLQKINFGTDKKFITLFEGQMGHGKSNLLNAFYWCLFTQYWDSDKLSLINDPDPDQVNLFNKGELKDNSVEGGKINLFVQIEFCDDEENRYTLKRSQDGVYIKKSWKFEKESKITLEKINSETGDYIKFSSEEALGEVQRFFPRSLSNYFLFRGENRTQLVKLQGKEEFQQALKELSKIEVFNRAESHLSAVLDDLRAELASQASEDIKREMEEVLSKKKNAEKVKSDFEVELNELITIEQKKKDEYDFYKEKIKENHQALELQNKIQIEQSQIDELQKQVQSCMDTKQKELTKKWAILGGYSIYKDIKDKYQTAVNSGQYPPDISKALINKILEELKCICGSDFKKNSDVYLKIQRLKEVQVIDPQLLHEVEKLVHELERGEQYVNSLPTTLQEIDDNIRTILSDIKSKQTIISGYKSKIGNIDFTLEQLQRKQEDANEEYIRTREKISELKGWIASKEKELGELEVAFQKLEEKIDKSNLPVIKVDLAEKSLKAARDLKKKFENSIYDDLEKYTQENWEVLVYDKLYYEKVILDRDSMYFEVLDKNGQPSRSIMNTGHSILLVLSFISGLIKIAKDVWEEEFPLVLDAPLSEIGDSAIPKALKGFGEIFNQTIVILKDGTVNEHTFNKIKGKVGMKYWIEFDKKRQHSKIKLINS